MFSELMHFGPAVASTAPLPGFHVQPVYASFTTLLRGNAPCRLLDWFTHVTSQGHRSHLSNDPAPRSHHHIDCVEYFFPL